MEKDRYQFSLEGVGQKAVQDQEERRRKEEAEHQG